MQVLENNDGQCLDTQEERQIVCDALLEMFEQYGYAHL